MARKYEDSPVHGLNLQFGITGHKRKRGPQRDEVSAVNRNKAVNGGQQGAFF